MGQRWNWPVAGLLILIPLAPGAVADDGDSARTAEQLLSRTEAAAQRPFDPRFRKAAAARLAALPGEELEAKLAAGGGIAPLALGDSDTQLIYTPVTPCRLIDTRLAGGSLAAGAVRDFKVTGAGLQIQGGNSAGCGVPFGPATAAVINFVAVNPVGPGNLRAWAYSTPAQPPPGASIINYPFGLTLANGLIVPICDPALTTCPGLDLKVQADVNGTHLVADVLGYFERFPKELVKSFSVVATTTTQTVIGSSCTNVGGLQATVTATVPGRIVVRATLAARLLHNQGTDDQLEVRIGTSAIDCTLAGAFLNVEDVLPSTNYNFSVPLTVAFDVVPGTYTYYANVFMTEGANGDLISSGNRVSTLEATFFPN
jgi:hypothetical protein